MTKKYNTLYDIRYIVDWKPHRRHTYEYGTLHVRGLYAYVGYTFDVYLWVAYAYAER